MKKIKFFPYDKFVIDSPMRLDEAVSALEQAIIQKPKWYQFWLYKKGHFVGNVSHEGFKIYRIPVHGHNSFLPIILGRFESQLVGTRIHITMRMNNFVNVFSVVWFGFMLLMFLFSIISLGSNSPELMFFVIITLVLIFVYLMVILSFLYGDRKGKEFLIKVFNGQIKEIDSAETI